MPEVATYCPEAAYLTKDNIVHPQSNRGAAGDAHVAAAEATARIEMAQRRGVSSVTGGAIKKGV